MVFSATFNNISVISIRSVSLVEETGVSGENPRSVPSHLQTLSHNVVSSTPRQERGLEFTTLVVIAQIALNSTTIRSRPRRPFFSYET
jgi:hypothetical protein